MVKDNGVKILLPNILAFSLLHSIMHTLHDTQIIQSAAHTDPQ